MSAFDLNDFSCLNKKLNSANVNTTVNTSDVSSTLMEKIIYSNLIIEEIIPIYILLKI